MKNGSLGHRAQHHLKHGGKQARDWRRKVAKLADRQPGDRTFTLKFPVDMAGRTLNFEQARQLYNTVEGTHVGSLYSYLLALHLAGFRLLSSREEAASFRARAAVSGEQFAHAAEEVFGLIASGLTPEALTTLLAAKPRKGLELYGPADMAQRLYFKIAGKRMDDKADASLADFCTELATHLCVRFDSWDALGADKAQRLQALDDYFQSKSDRFPKFVQAGGAVVESEAALDSPLAYQGDPWEMNTDDVGCWLHACVARYLPEALLVGNTTKQITTVVQTSILSSQTNGLSWAFNKGLVYFKTTSPEKVAQDFGVPEAGVAALRQLQQVVLAVPEPVFLSVPHYADFRRTVAGKLSSWIANYINRLEELKALFDKPRAADIPKAVHDAHADGLFQGLEDALQSWSSGQAQLPDLLAGAHQSLRALAGLEGRVGAADVKRMDDVAEALRYIAGFERMLLARIDQRSERLRESPYGLDLLAWAKQRADALEKIPALQQISGALPDLDTEATRRGRQLNALLKLQDQLSTRIREKVTGQGDLATLLQRMVGQESRHLQAHPNAEMLNQPEMLSELAARRFLQGLGSLHKRLSPFAQHELRETMQSWRLMPRKQHLNAWLVNQKGAIYVSPWARNRRHEALKLNANCWVNARWLKDLESLAARWAPAGLAQVSTTIVKDWLQLKQHLLRAFAQCLEGELDPALLEGVDLESRPLSPQLRAALRRAPLQSVDVQRLIGMLQGELAQTVQDCLRRDVVVRAKFQLIDSATLLYVPKDRQWTVPARYGEGEEPIARAISAFDVQVAPDSVASQELAKRLSGALRDADQSALAGELLRQVPHDWYLPSSLTLSAVEGEPLSVLEGIPIEKCGAKAKAWSEKPAVGRLIGVSSFKSVLDRTLIDAEVTIGNWMLIINQHYTQVLSFKDGQAVIEFGMDKQQVELAVPIGESANAVQPSGDARLFNRVVGIDLGERRIGFSVFDLNRYVEEGCTDPIVNEQGVQLSGTVSIPSIRSLIQEVQSYRRREQPGQKLSDKFSHRLEQYRENVVADVCRVIDALCAEFGGFPVLESSVRNFEQGARQLDLVYKTVVNMYSFSAVDAHKTKRSQRWFGADKWTHPTAKSREWDELKREYSNKFKPLTLFPGALISPAGTSQTCCVCQRNPFAALRGLPAKTYVEQGGTVQTDLGVIRLLKGAEYSKEDFMRAKRNLRRLPPNRAVPEGMYATRDLEGALKQSLRQAPGSLRTKDSTQSVYSCVFVDCQSVHHADEGAAINIARKFLMEKIGRQG